MQMLPQVGNQILAPGSTGQQSGHPSIKLQEDALKCIMSEISNGSGAGAGDPTPGNPTTEEWVYALSQNLVARAGLLLDLGCIADTASSSSGSDGGGGQSSSGAPYLEQFSRSVGVFERNKWSCVLRGLCYVMHCTALHCTSFVLHHPVLFEI